MPNLILSRKAGEKIIIGDDITITVEKIFGGRVAVGIEAPKEVRVLRGELIRKDIENGKEEVCEISKRSA